MVGSNNKYLPVAWQSKRIRRVVKNTLAAETLVMVDITEACLFYKKQLLEILQLKDKLRTLKLYAKQTNPVSMTQYIHLHKFWKETSY